MKQSDLNKIKSSADIVCLQSIVDDLKSVPQFAQYVQQRKLSLIDGKWRLLDNLLSLGILV